MSLVNECVKYELGGEINNEEEIFDGGAGMYLKR